MKILILNDDYPPYNSNSVAEIAHTQAVEFQSAGNDVLVVTTHRTKDDSALKKMGNVLSIPVSYRHSLTHWLGIKNAKVTRQLEKIIDEYKPDVVHAHNIHKYLTYDALRIARKHTPHVFITMHDVMSFSFGRLATKKYIESDGTDTRISLWEQYRQVGLMWNPFRNTLIRKRLHNAERIIAVSRALEKALNANGIGNTQVIYHGIDVHTWNSNIQDTKQVKEKYNLVDKKVILFGGRLSIDKGAIALLNALAILCKTVPNVRVLVLGETKKWDALLAHAKVDANIAALTVCTGWLPPEKLPTLFYAADLVTTPSLCLDTFNLMNLEAMASSKPVVGTLFGGTPEVVEHDVNGFICNPLHTEEYAAYMEKVLIDPTLATTMGKAGNNRAITKFSLEKNIHEYLELFSSTT